MCDVAYSLCVERVEARALADRQVAATLMAAGAKVDLVDPDERRSEFDDWLMSPLERVDEDVERAEWRRVMGL